MLRILALSAALVLATSAAWTSPIDEKLFDDPSFRHCISWMLSGYRGALMERPCEEAYDLPPPALFLCARKIQDGFPDAMDQEACAIVFEEAARKVRAGYVR